VLRALPPEMAGERLWLIAKDGHGWMPCRLIGTRWHALVWRTAASGARHMGEVLAPAPFQELADAVPLNALVDAIAERVQGGRASP
jgi:hypothetical protein